MYARVWLACAVITGRALPATLPRGRQNERNPNDSALTLRLHGNVSTATTEALDTVNNATAQRSNQTSFYDVPLGDDSTTALNAGPWCDGNSFGYDLDRYSCFDAWRNIGLNPESAAWGPRGGKHKYQYGLPARWSSGTSATEYLYDVVASIDGSL